MEIPFVDLKRQHAAIRDEVASAMAGVLESTAFIRGRAVREFEAAFAHMLGVRHAIGVASGTDALHMAVRALGIGPGDEVITQANTWISSAFAASFVGATPVLVDIDPQTLQMDVESMKRAVTPATRAVIPVHLFGHPAPVLEIVDFCRARGIRVIEDVAQAPLASLGGHMAGAIGDIGCFSFYPSKNLGCYGDGGAVVTNDDALAHELTLLTDYGQSETQSQDHHIVGFNSRLDSLQAAVLTVKLRYLEGWTEARREKAARYAELLADLAVKTPVEAAGARHVYHLYVIEMEDRDRAFETMREKGALVQIHYPTPLHLQACYADLGQGPGDLPVAEAAAGRILSLPLYPELTEAEMRYIVDRLAEVCPEK